MDIVVKGLRSGYEAEHLARVFFPGAAVRPGRGTGGDVVYARAGRAHLAVGLRREGVCRTRRAKLPAGGLAGEKDLKTQLCRLLYELLCEATGQRPPWGMLTGVRPVSLLRKTLREGGEAEARRVFLEGYGVNAARYEMAAGIERLQRPILAKSGEASYSLYVSIPFCPTRCAYCSFVSKTIAREGHLVQPYLEKLCEELAETAKVAARCGLQLSTVYVGGGTPTALTAPQLETLLESIARHFPLHTAAEFTVEAGRPDCTDLEKLTVLREYGVTRISVNPQTLCDDVLQNIGRRHTAADVLRCVADARAAGHDDINMDLIAGLPGDDEAGFEKTLGGVLALAPENVTLHALTLKRASDLARAPSARGASPSAMLDAAYPRLFAAGYRPYYLYRQKSGVENLENTGWAKPGREGLYNVFIMEEAHTILACGAGAATKLVRGGGAVIRRRYNHKFPADYIQNFEEVLHRKRGVSAFYGGDMDPEAAG